MKYVEGGCNRDTNNLLKEQGSSANLHHDQKNQWRCVKKKKKKNKRRDKQNHGTWIWGREILEQLPEMGTDTRPMQHGPYRRVFKSKSGRKGERKIAGKRKDSFIYDLVVLLSSFYL